MSFFSRVNQISDTARAVGNVVNGTQDILQAVTGRPEPRPRRTSDNDEDDQAQELGGYYPATQNVRLHSEQELRSRADTEASLMIAAMDGLNLVVRFVVIGAVNNPADEWDYYQYREMLEAAEQNGKKLEDLKIENEYLYQQFYVIARKCKQNGVQWQHFETDRPELKAAYEEIEKQCERQDVPVVEFPKSLFQFKETIKKGKAAQQRQNIIRAFAEPNKNDLRNFQAAVAEARYYELLRQDEQGTLQPVSSWSLLFQIGAANLVGRFVTATGQQLADGDVSVSDLLPKFLQSKKVVDDNKYDQFLREYGNLWGIGNGQDAPVVELGSTFEVSKPQTDYSESHEQRKELSEYSDADVVE
jgi:hypothetical protein